MFFLLFHRPPSKFKIDSTATITVGNKTFEIKAQDLIRLATLGSGAFGIVDRMEHHPTGTVMAVKVT